MGRIQLSSLGPGVAVKSGDGGVLLLAAGQAGTITLHSDESPIPVYPAETGGSADASGRFVTDAYGHVPGWIDDGYVGTAIDITVPPAPSITFHLAGSAIADTRGSTEGDLLVFDADSLLFERLPVGTDGKVLTADSTQDQGMRWATPSSTATPVGAAGGDLNGNYPNPGVAKLAGIPASGYVGDARGTAAGDVLVFDGAEFARLPVGSVNKQLTVRSDGTVAWTPPPQISVTSWGAKGDGATDDGAAINTCISNSPTGSQIDFGSLTYLTSVPIVLYPDRSYIGRGHAFSGTGNCATIKQKNGSNITATGALAGLVVSHAWATNATLCDDPIRFENICIDGNFANNATSTACGLVFTNFWSVARGCYIINTPKHGLLLTDTTANGSNVVTNSCSENRVLENKFNNTGGHGICQISGNSNSNMDGYCLSNIFQSCQGDGINFQRGAGWMFWRNHMYGTKGNGILLQACYATVVEDNYIEDFGLANVATVYYGGINIASQLNGRATRVVGNTISCTEPTANVSHYNYLAVVAGAGQTARVSVRDNTLLGPAVASGNGIGIVGDRASGSGTIGGSVTNNDVQSISTPYYFAGTFVTLILRGNPGINPIGVVTPAVPATGVAVPFANYDRTFYVTAAAGGCTMTVQGGPAVVIPANAVTAIRVPAGQTVTPTFTNAPTWVVLGE